MYKRAALSAHLLLDEEEDNVCGDGDEDEDADDDDDLMKLKPGGQEPSPA